MHLYCDVSNNPEIPKFATYLMNNYVIIYALFNIFFLCMRAEVQIYAQLIDVKHSTPNLILYSIQAIL